MSRTWHYNVHMFESAVLIREPAAAGAAQDLAALPRDGAGPQQRSPHPKAVGAGAGLEGVLADQEEAFAQRLADSPALTAPVRTLETRGPRPGRHPGIFETTDCPHAVPLF